ncbi:MAG: methionine adenosyltransferase [Bdellovibrionales bacterium CG10_big_fil_rev_8_21_14_0_10_45_34]|nr:MAG: methionine adenosyltransferase [Bdellovibrionales bacterium CG10_big_fil_rev_8_21_14_0_10_45_34]
MSKYLFSSESVSEGHPDKMADQVSDAVLDAILKEDPAGRVACETLLTTGLVVVAGEITTKAQINIQEIARGTIKNIGYDAPEKGFDYRTCAVLSSVGRQSPDIAMGVDTSANREQGAGDQGIMFGYAVNETDVFMPMTIHYSHQIMKKLAELRKSGKANFLYPDSKSQVTVEYENGKAKRVDTVVVSTQHSEDAKNSDIEASVRSVVNGVIPANLLDSKTKYLINPTGRFVLGGPHADCGLTGRKIIVDTYGGHGSHGGGAFSGKDPSKVDRSAAYAGRHIAKNIVGAGLAEKCLVQIAYAIGVAEPVSVMVNDYGSGKVPTEKLENAIREFWSLKPAAIIERFDLTKPRYSATAAYGHFGREESSFTWEKLDMVDALKDFCK